ncbi:MAG TPA: hypothetical protein ENN21_10160 [Spirochaetes bacterium]|nr:hypothetical protein [Spirochaetota bacterium]
MAKAMPLLKAYMTNSIPPNGGFIITSYFDADTVYTIYEVTAYSNVKDIFKSPEGWVFKTDGNRTHALVEPPTFNLRYTEPVHREKGKSIPYRFSEVDIIDGKKLEKIMIPKEPIMLYSSFTILETSGDNFTYIFFPTEDVYTAIRKFMADSFYNDCGLVKENAIEASKLLLGTVKKFSVWK